jgi:hypothetical protein
MMIDEDDARPLIEIVARLIAKHRDEQRPISPDWIAMAAMAELDPDRACRACNPLVWRLSLEGLRQIAREMLGQPTEPADIDAVMDADRARVQGDALLRHAEALEAWRRSRP